MPSLTTLDNRYHITKLAIQKYLVITPVPQSRPCRTCAYKKLARRYSKHSLDSFRSLDVSEAAQVPDSVQVMAHIRDHSQRHVMPETYSHPLAHATKVPFYPGRIWSSLAFRRLLSKIVFSAGLQRRYLSYPKCPGVLVWLFGP